MSELWQLLVSLFSSAFFTTLIGAAVGGWATFYAVKYEIKKQNEADRRKGEIEDQNKLRYLLFLIEDIYKIVDTFEQASDTFSNSVLDNPYIIPDMASYHSYSLEAVASKINQEDYYLAALKRLNDKNFTEVFRMLNALEATYRSVKDHFRNEFPNLIQDKLEYGESTLAVHTILYNLRNDRMDITFTKLNIMEESIGNLFHRYPQPLHTGRLDQLDLLFPQIERIVIGSKYEHQLTTVKDKRQRYLGRIRNVDRSIKRSKEEMSKIIALVKNTTLPLKRYIDSLDE